MNYVEYAKNEFLKIGYKPIEECEDGPDKWIQENVLDILQKISEQGHSGSSINYLVDYISRLAKYEPLSPLLGDDSEWAKVDDECWQNVRCSHVFKNKNGKAYDIDGYIFWHWSERDLEPDEEGYPGVHKYKSYFTDRMSRKKVEFPYYPEKPIYIEVQCFEVNKETNEPELGSGWWKTIYPDEFKSDLGEI